MVVRLSVLCLVLLLSAVSSRSAELFPFVISYDAPDNLTNVSSWLHKPAGKHGFVRAEKGRLVTDAGPIRFWATNFCFEACFPSHEMAERVAARLARLGINCVRMHHMDYYSIWGDSPNKTTLDPKKLERLDYLIAQLKRHGVYTNINLHVSRSLGDKEGFPHRDQRPDFDKGVGNFEPRMIELQKKYARDLLTHVNPYTKTAYVDEPAVAFVEISNEDALFAVWGWNQLDNLPDPYAATLREQWNAWLRRKHKTTDALRKAWNVGSKPLGDELLTNGDFAKPIGEPWHLETDDQAKARWSVEKGGPGGTPCLRVVVEKMGGQSWVPQFQQGGIPMRKGQVYTLRFHIRSDKPRRISLNAMMAHEPWKQFGFHASVDATPTWTEVRRTFIPDTTDDNGRVTFTDLSPGTLEVAGVSLRPGGIVGLEAGQTLEDNRVPVLKHGEMTVTPAARRDFVDFLWDTEQAYWLGMYRFLKDELKCRSIISGTQLSYSPAHIQAQLDYIDSHSYWQHPHFPGKPWDMGNWMVGDVALVNTAGGTLAGLAARRVYGKPFTVSEYNHPAPISYSAEGFPMIAAFGAFQGWDGIFTFAYCHNERFEPRTIDSFFDIKGHTPKIATSIACAALFLRGDVRRYVPPSYLAHLPREAERRRLGDDLNAWNLKTSAFGLDERHGLLKGVGLWLGDKTPAIPAAAPAPIPDGQNVFVSDTGEMRWDLSQKGAGCFTVDTACSKLFTGFVRGRTFELGNVSLAIGKTRLGWATVTLTCIDGKGFDQPGRILITATGACQNKDWKLESRGGDRVTLGRNWGSEPVLCEGVPAEITFPVAPARVKLFPLDERGNRREAIPVSGGGKAVLTLGPEHETVWYEVEIQR